MPAPDAHFNLGIVHQEKGDMSEALKGYDTASRLDPALHEAVEAAERIRNASA